jgi:hypothetical protein
MQKSDFLRNGPPPPAETWSMGQKWKRLVATMGPILSITCFLKACTHKEAERTEAESSEEKPYGLGGQGGALATHEESDFSPEESEGNGGVENSGVDTTNDCSERCSSEELCCGEECIETSSDVEHCGACDLPCGDKNGSPSCDEGRCSIRCDDGFYDCDGESEDGCEFELEQTLVTPRPLKPTVGHFTGRRHASNVTNSLRPTLTWRKVSPQGCGTLSYEIEIDDSCEAPNFDGCSFESSEVHVSTEQERFTPDSDLPVSTQIPVGTRYYWRVRSCEEGLGCSDWSEVRYIEVGRDIQDVTGDGFADLVAQKRQGGYAIFQGGPSFASESPLAEDRLFEEEGNAGSHEDNAATIRFVGDVDGDGFNDFAASGDGSATQVGGGDYPNGPPTYLDLTRYVFFGAEKVAEIAALPFLIPKGGYGLAPTTGAGDFNRDGYADLLSNKSTVYVESADGLSDQIPAGYLLFGGPHAREGLEIDKEILPPVGQNRDYFASTSDFGDFNGDGLVDLVLSAPSGPSAVIVAGSKDGSVEIDAVVPQGGKEATQSSCQDARIAVGDLNLDGFDDFAITCQRLGMVQVFLGSSSLALEFAHTLIVPGAQDGTHLVYDVAIGDITSDGYPDLLTSEGVVYLGGAELTLEPSFLPGITGESYFGIGDHNGDGWLDVTLVPRSSSGGQASWRIGGSFLPLSASADPKASSSSPVLLVDRDKLGWAVGR